jgi:hypothetical protein
MANVFSSANLSAVTYVANEVINVGRGATLTINSNPTIHTGSINVLTSGTVLLENTTNSIATPLVFEFARKGDIFDIRNSGRIFLAGASVDAFTTTGSATWSVNLAQYPQLHHCEIFDPVTGLTRAVPIISTNPRYRNLNHTNLMSLPASELGSYFECVFWDETTRTLSGGGNGYTFASGLTIRVPNIIICDAQTRELTTISHSLQSIGTPTGGTFTITVRNTAGTVLGTTSALAFNITAAALKTALELITGAGTMTTSGGPLPTSITITHASTQLTTGLEFEVTPSLTGGTAPLIFDRDISTAVTGITVQNGGRIDGTGFSLSAKGRLNLSNTGGVNLFSCGVSSALIMSGVQTASLLKNVSINQPVFTSPAVTSAFTSVIGSLTIDNLSVAFVEAGRSLVFTNCTDIRKFNDVGLFNSARRVSANGTVIQLVGSSIKSPVKNLRGLGGRLLFQNTGNLSLISPRHGDTTRATRQTTQSANGLVFTTVVDVLISDYQLLGFPCQAAIFSADSACARFAVYGITYNMSPVVLNAPFIFSGDTCDVFDVDLGTTSTGANLIGNNGSFTSKGPSIKPQFNTGGTGTYAPVSGAQVEGYKIGSFTGTGTLPAAGLVDYSGGLFYQTRTTNVPATEQGSGYLVFGPFGVGDQVEYSGGAYNSDGRLYLESAGAQVTITLPWSIRSLSGFLGNYLVEGDFPKTWHRNNALVNQARSNSSIAISPGAPTGGTFTLSAVAPNGSVIGTTTPLAFNASAATVQTAYRLIPSQGLAVVSGTSLTSGFTLASFPEGGYLTINGSGLTGGGEPGVAYAYNSSIGLPLVTTGSDFEYFTSQDTLFEISAKVPGSDWTPWTELNTTNINTLATTATNPLYIFDQGVQYRLRATVQPGSDFNPYRSIRKVGLGINYNRNGVANNNCFFTLRGLLTGDVVTMYDYSSQAPIKSFTATVDGTQVWSTTVGNDLDRVVYFDRFSTGSTVVNNRPTYFKAIAFGDNGIVDLFYGAQVQAAIVVQESASGGGNPVDSANIASIKATVDLNLDAKISTRLDTATATTQFGSLASSIASVPNNVLDATVEPSATVRQSLQINNALLAGTTQGAGTGTETFYSMDGNKERVVATVTAVGERTAIVRDHS